ncbi:hypothetical protein AB0Y39_10020, partial [Weissella paramesenteroides]
HKGRHSLFLYNLEIFCAFTQDILRSLFGYLSVKFAHKIVEYNSIPPHVEGCIVDNNTADDTSEDTADIEAYIANELISEETKHRNSHDDLD